MMKRRYSLSLFIIGTGLLPVVLLFMAVMGTRIAVHDLRNMNICGSLRFRSLWLYGATHAVPAEDWRPMWGQMESIRRRLRVSYPADMARTDGAWNAVSDQLTRTGRVDWKTADALREACNVLTLSVERQARGGAERASWMFALGLVGITILLTKSLRMARRTERAEAEHRHLSAILEATPDFVGMADLQGRILYLNRAFHAMAGLAPGALLRGLHISDCHPPQTALVLRDEVLPIVRKRGFWTGESFLLNKDGQAMPVSQTILAHRDADGEVVRYSTIARDMTGAREAVQELEQSRALFAASVEAMQEGFVVQDRNGAALLCNASAERILGLEVGTAQGRNVMTLGWRVVHEDGSEWPRDRQPSRLALSTGQPQRDVVMRFEKEDGTFLLLLFHAYPLFHAGEAHAYAAVTTFVDITAKRAAEDALRRAEQNYHSIVEHAVEGILQGTPDGRILSANPALARILGYRDVAHMTAEITDIGQQMYADPADRLRLLSLIREHGKAEAFEAPLRRLDGDTVWVSMNVRSVRDDAGELLYLEGTLEDITERREAAERLHDYSVVLEFQKAELEKANAELEMLATTDGLTGLKNHRTFQQRLAEACETAERYGTSLSLLMLDVDHFKQYNDAFGHPEGDTVLRQVAAILSRTARTTDMAARYGGEEFAVILPHTDAEGAAIFGERVRAAMERAEWAHRAVTVSVGVCTLSPDKSTPADLVTGADAAMYLSKLGGRNRVTAGTVTQWQTPAAA